MSESSNQQVNDRTIVIQRGFELSEFNALLAKLGVATEICSGALPTADRAHRISPFGHEPSRSSTIPAKHSYADRSKQRLG